MIARALKLDPLEFRRKNMLRDGRPQATGTILKDAPLDEVLERVAERMNWSAAVRSRHRHAAARPRHRDRLQGGRSRRRRRWRSSTSAPTAARRSIAAPSTWARAPTPRWRRSSAKCSTFRPRSVRVVPRDTDVTPYDMGTLGSRSLFHMGHAVRLAAEEARDKIAALAREVGEPEGSNIPLAELFQKKYGMQAGNIVGTGTYKPDYIAARSRQPARRPTRRRSGWSAAAGAEVEVDTETGHVRIAQAGQRRRLRPADQSADRRDADFRRVRSCSSASRCSRRCISTPARSPMPRSPTTRSRAFTTCRR